MSALGHPRRGHSHQGYSEFPNEARRNAAQELIEVPALVRSLRLPKEARILEAGCGRGVALAPLARLCVPRRLVGLEIDARLIAEARERLGARRVRAELVCGDVRQMPFADDSFDVVVDFGTCYHINCPETALREIARVLGEGGAFIHETPISQLLAHPVRSGGRRLPWAVMPELGPSRSALLWSSRQTRRTSPAPFDGVPWGGRARRGGGTRRVRQAGSGVVEACRLPIAPTLADAVLG